MLADAARRTEADRQTETGKAPCAPQTSQPAQSCRRRIQYPTGIQPARTLHIRAKPGWRFAYCWLQRRTYLTLTQADNLCSSMDAAASGKLMLFLCRGHPLKCLPFCALTVAELIHWRCRG